jgi:hypothetical protein
MKMRRALRTTRCSITKGKLITTLEVDIAVAILEVIHLAVDIQIVEDMMRTRVITPHLAVEVVTVIEVVTETEVETTTEGEIFTTRIGSSTRSRKTCTPPNI